METNSVLTKTINTLITKHNDLNAKFLSFSAVANGDALKGMLLKHADMHRFFSLQLVHDFKTYAPETQLNLNRTFANAIEMGWKDIKASLGLENDNELENNISEEHNNCAILCDEAYLQVPETMPNLKNTIEEHIAWHKKVSEHLPDTKE